MTLSAAEKKRLQTKYGPWAVVTGASSGIGWEIARHLADAGLHILLTGRSSKELQGVAQSLKEKHQVDTLVVEADLSTKEGVQQVIEASEQVQVGLFVGAAGYGTSGLFIQSSILEELDMLQVNCEALLRLSHHFSKSFVENKRGGLILMSSMVGFQGVPYAAHYAATKAYVQSLAEALAVELKPYGVDVLAAAPGPVASGFATRANMQMSLSLTPEQVGMPIIQALGRTSTVLPGWLTKVLVYSLGTVPRWAKVQIMKKVMYGMTKHHVQQTGYASSAMVSSKN